MEQCDEIKVVTQPEYVINCLNKFIRFNRNLQSVNLSNTGLNSQVLVGITQSLRHAKGLLCLHLSANPGLNDKVEQFYRKRLSVLPQRESIYINVVTEDIEGITEVELLGLNDTQRQVHEQKLRKLDGWRLEEVFHYLNNKRLKPLFNRQDVDIKPEGNELILTRILGHKDDIPGSGQWNMKVQKEKDGCWHCDNWMYSLVFWHPDIGNFNSRNSIGCTKETKRKVLQQIKNDVNAE